ncbi:DUF3783 domain-containing protein [Clostridium sp. MCC353]|uniref:DUF3783 domain-containing protein n=1 Tax=Clostridium sp. MCC353 TaxID=2592646 RepID=UPI001C018F66|nr:DUF3783 domain-containing protein [Clostridium sp. MCC353]MBT9775235.1 DUF3783 domain-containing protein [Clostridium sp. MCC353]
MAALMKSVLYYTPEQTPKVNTLKGIFVRLGIRIKNIAPEQVTQQVGYLAGLPGFEEQKTAGELPVIKEEVLVLKNFTGQDIDVLLQHIKKAGLTRIALKAVLTESNSKWTFYQLYQEIKEEHEVMSGKPVSPGNDEP